MKELGFLAAMEKMQGLAKQQERSLYHPRTQELKIEKDREI